MTLHVLPLLISFGCLSCRQNEHNMYCGEYLLVNMMSSDAQIVSEGTRTFSCFLDRPDQQKTIPCSTVNNDET